MLILTPLLQLNLIKEKARDIAELPEDDFNDLVVNARDFSLARGRLSQSTHSSVMSTGSRHSTLTSSDDHGDEDDEGCERNSCSRVSSVPVPSPDLSAEPQPNNLLNNDYIPRFPMTFSSQFSHRISNLSDTDSSDMEGKGAFDYFPQKEKIRITHTYKPDYDEEVELESDKSSVESPRSDVSSTHEYNFPGSESELGTEMITYKTYSNNDDPIHNLYRQGGMELWESKTSQRACSASVSFPNSKICLETGQSISSIRGSNTSIISKSVDDGVKFTSLGSSLFGRSENRSSDEGKKKKKEGKGKNTSFEFSLCVPSSCFSIFTLFNSLFNSKAQDISEFIHCLEPILI